MKTPPIRLIALEITRTCNLKCKHCRGDSKKKVYRDELTFDEIKSILSNVASFSKPIIIVTGGEPLVRPDVFDITGYSSSLGLNTVLATCGHFLTDETIMKLIETGVSRISVSLDGPTPELHDNFRGVTGAFEASVKGLKIAKRYGLDFQINSTITKINVDNIEALYELSLNLGAVGFHPFLLVPMGRGAGIADYALSPEVYENTLNRIAEMASVSPIEIKPTCSPHYSRIVRQIKNRNIEKSMSQSSYKSSAKHSEGKHTSTHGCIGGKNFAFISHKGKVQICGFLEVEAGDLRTNGYNFKSIWETSEFLRQIRDTDNYDGKCGICEYRNVCGGCRARAYYSTGDYLGSEPNCIYSPDTVWQSTGEKNEKIQF